MIFTKGRQIMNRNSYKMSGKAIKLYRIRLVLLAVAVSFFCGGVMVFSVEIALVLIAFFGIAVVVLIIWLPLFIYKGYVATIENNHIAITKQLIFSRTYYVSFEDIRYLTLSATPLQRYFNIFSVYIHTSSGKVCIANTNRLPYQLKGFLK